MVRKSEKGEVPPEVRRQHVDQWRRSGLSKGAYCVQSGIAVNQLSYWVSRHREVPSLEMAPAFVRVVTPDLRTQPLTGPVTVAARLMVGMTMVEIINAADPLWAADLMAAIGGLRR